MASIRRIGRLLPIMFLPLSACSRQPPTEEQANKAIKSCGMIMQDMYDGAAWDTGYNVIVVKRISPAEFDKKIPCLKFAFFMSKIEASVENGKEGGVDIGF